MAKKAEESAKKYDGLDQIPAALAYTLFKIAPQFKGLPVSIIILSALTIIAPAIQLGARGMSLDYLASLERLRRAEKNPNSKENEKTRSQLECVENASGTVAMSAMVVGMAGTLTTSLLNILSYPKSAGIVSSVTSGVFLGCQLLMAVFSGLRFKGGMIDLKDLEKDIHDNILSPNPTGGQEEDLKPYIKEAFGKRANTIRSTHLKYGGILGLAEMGLFYGTLLFTPMARAVLAVSAFAAVGAGCIRSRADKKLSDYVGKPYATHLTEQTPKWPISKALKHIGGSILGGLKSQYDRMRGAKDNIVTIDAEGVEETPPPETPTSPTADKVQVIKTSDTDTTPTVEPSENNEDNLTDLIKDFNKAQDKLKLVEVFSNILKITNSKKATDGFSDILTGLKAYIDQLL
ncbi:MAG: hypothetical protein AAF621_08645, partial [Pseudomonadota bacterium]